MREEGTISKADAIAVLKTTARIVTFRATREDILAFNGRHLAFGLFCTWLVGMGRSWDNPKAELLQYLGVGSVAYVFGLALLMWAAVNPFIQAKRLYIRILTYICLVSPPGLIYAVPVEKFLAPEAARNCNMAFLALVAIWRVALWVYYLSKLEGLSWKKTLVLTLLPLASIMAPLTIIQVLANTLENMGGVRAERFTDPVAAAWQALGVLSIWAFVPLLIAYMVLLARRKKAIT